jgi:hypothetical protein
MRGGNVTSTPKRVVIVGAAILAISISARAANKGAEQVVFSTPGFQMQLSGNQHATSTPFGFWIWCAAEAAATSRGGYQNANACQGNMYFYALDTHATPVLGEVDEIDDGIYSAHVVQTTFAKFKANGFVPPPDSPYFCTLTNLDPDPIGPNNRVRVDCTFSSALGGGTGTAIVTNAVVNVTGSGH